MLYTCTFRPGYHTILDDPADAPPQERYEIEADSIELAQVQLMQKITKPGCAIIRGASGPVRGVVIREY